MPRKLTSLIGQKFGRLTVMSLAPKREGKSEIRWLCACDCGKEHTVDSGHLKGGTISSCGCSNSTHGETKTPLYAVWRNMRQRCHDKNYPRYADWGGRGISICKEWDDFVAFKEWSLSSGYQPGLELDRENNDGNYAPENCRYVTSKENSRNRRSSKLNPMRVRVIGILLKRGIKQNKIAEMYDVHPTMINRIVKQKAWI